MTELFKLACLRTATLLLVLTFSAATSPGHAQDEEAKPETPVAEEMPEAKENPVVAEKLAVEKELREQTIYVPFNKLSDVFEKEGRGVFLPYEKFQALWQAARAQQTPISKPGLPFTALITEADSVAEVQGDVVRVQAKLTIELLKSGWNTIPLRLHDAAILSATIEDETARVVPVDSQGYALWVENRKSSGKTLQLELVYAKAYTKTPGRNSVSFAAPLSPVNRWRFSVAETGAKINIFPLIAATEPPKEKAVYPDENPNDEPKKTEEDTDSKKRATETALLAYVGAAPEVRVEWTPKSEGATGLESLATVQTEHTVHIEAGAMRTRGVFHYEITRSELAQLQIDVPEDQKVVNVFDANVRKWEVTPLEKSQRIVVDLFQPVRGKQTLIVELEKFSEATMGQSTIIKPIAAANVVRQQGFLVVKVDPAMRAEVSERTGLSQIDLSELPGALQGQAWNFTYGFNGASYAMTLKTENVIPRLTADYLVEAYLEPRQLTLEMTTLYSIENTGVFQLEIAIPAGFQVQSVRGQAVLNHAEVMVDRFQQTGENGTRLEVSLAKKAMGKVGLFIQLSKTLAEAQLLQPSGTATVAIPVPQPQQQYLEKAKGSLLVYAPESLRINPEELAGFRTVSFAEAAAMVPTQRANRFAGLRETLAFAVGDESESLPLAVERRKPFVTVRQLLATRVDAGVIAYTADFFYEIRYSSVDSLRIDIPAELAKEIRNQSPNLRESVIEPTPEGAPAEYVSWRITSESELLGNRTVRLTWERKLDDFEIAKPIQIDVPSLRPAQVDRAWGQIVIAKAETIDVQPTDDAVGLRPIDPRHDLMPGAQGTDWARAFEFHQDWKLMVAATRYQPEEVKRTSIERAFLRMVTTRSKQVGVQALYRIQSAQQRLALRLPKGTEFDSQPLRIDGQVVTLERGEKDDLYIPLANHDVVKPFVLELRYTVPGDWSNLAAPVFVDDPAMQKVYLAVYLPEEMTVLGNSGPWTSENTWTYSDLNWKPRPERDDNELAAWVREGLSAAEVPAFQTDGSMFVYSTLHPDPPPEGSLRIVAMPTKGFAALTFSLFAVLGMVMYSRPFGQKLLGLAIVLAFLITSGIFAPTFARQIISLPFLAAMSLVAILWGCWYVLHVFPQQLQGLKQAWRSRQPEAQPTTELATGTATATDATGGDRHE